METLEERPDIDQAPKVDLAGNSWELPTDLRVVGQIIDEIERRLQDLGWDTDSIADVLAAFDELIVNAIAHGNQELGSHQGDVNALFEASTALFKSNPSDKRVFVTFQIEDNRVGGSVRDQGQGYEPTDEAEKAVTGGLLNPYGRGHLLLKKTLDSLEYKKEDGVGTTATFSYTRKQPHTF